MLNYANRLKIILFLCFQMALQANDAIFFMQNFDPKEWQAVFINEERLDELATVFAYDERLKAPSWKETLPSDLTLEESINYLLGLIAIDFCHFGIKETKDGMSIVDFYTENDEGKVVRGSMAMTELAKKAYARGIKLFEAPFMSAASVDDLRFHFIGFDQDGNEMEIPLLEERVKIMNEVGKVLITKWGGSFYNVFLASQGRVINQGKGFVEMLIRDFSRYRDEYFYQGKKIGIYKLAQLSVFALENAALQENPLFSDSDVLTLCADYQIPRCLHALGVLEYEPFLEMKIQNQELVSKNSLFEIELRMATVFAGSLLKDKINEIRSKKQDPLISSQELDHLLWSCGRILGKENRHHLTITTMY